MRAVLLGVLAAVLVTLAIAYFAWRIARRRRVNVTGTPAPPPFETEERHPPENTSTPDASTAGWLACTSGPLAGQRFEIRPEGIYIGREGSLAHVVVADSRVSKRHVWVGPRAGRITAVDQGSTNGTFLNHLSSRRIAEVFLNPGDTIILSEFDVARFQYQK